MLIEIDNHLDGFNCTMCNVTSFSCGFMSIQILLPSPNSEEYTPILLHLRPRVFSPCFHLEMNHTVMLKDDTN